MTEGLRDLTGPEGMMIVADPGAIMGRAGVGEIDLAGVLSEIDDLRGRTFCRVHGTDDADWGPMPDGLIAMRGRAIEDHRAGKTGPISGDDLGGLGA